MVTNTTKYYFSVRSLVFTTMLFVGIATLSTFLFLAVYRHNFFYAVLFSAPLIVLLIALPDYIRFLYCALIGRPALELTKDVLIDNTNATTYKWTDIKQISYKPFTGIKAPPGGYIEVVLHKSEKIIRLPKNSIKGKLQDLLGDLQMYLQSAKKGNRL